ncbi:hypothetical protein [Azospirillum melinis]
MGVSRRIATVPDYLWSGTATTDVAQPWSISPAGCPTRWGNPSNAAQEGKSVKPFSGGVWKPTRYRTQAGTVGGQPG